MYSGRTINSDSSRTIFYTAKNYENIKLWIVETVKVRPATLLRNDLESM